MTNPTLLITGAAQGTGAAAARIAAQMEAQLVLAARSEDALVAIAKEITDIGGSALAVAGDVTQTTDCQRIVARAVKAFGGLDALVNNADAVEPIASIAGGDPEAWKENWSVNVQGPVTLTHVALPHLRKRGGRVINVSSEAAVKIIPGWAAYSVAKAAIDRFTLSLAEEEPTITAIALRSGIANSVMLAAIRGAGAQGIPKDVYARIVRQYEKGKLLPPEVPGCAMAVLALHAPHAWSGAALPWNSEDVQSLVRQFACASSS
jgi:NAD(P)-dependent dehydrogenase (short-subunit alcohol dehydrogenase family)